MLLGPLTRRVLAVAPILPVAGGPVGRAGVGDARVAHQPANGSEKLGNGLSESPNRCEHVEANVAVPIDVGVVDLAFELDLQCRISKKLKFSRTNMDENAEVGVTCKSNLELKKESTLKESEHRKLR